MGQLVGRPLIVGCYDPLNRTGPSGYSGRLGTLVERRAGLWEIPTRDPKGSLPGILETAETLKVPFQQVHVRRATLEDVFLHRTGRSLRD